MKFNWNKKYSTIAIYSIIVFSVCYAIYKLTDDIVIPRQTFITLSRTLSPFFFAFLIAYFINPILVFFEKKVFYKVNHQKIRRGLSIALSYIVILGLIVLLLSFVIPQIIDNTTEISKQISSYLPIASQWLNQGEIVLFNTFTVDLSLLSNELNNTFDFTQALSSLSTMLSNFAPFILSALSQFTSTLLNIILGFIIAVYILNKKEAAAVGFEKIIIALFPPKKATDILNTIKESHKIFTSFLFGKIIDSVIIGIICFIILLVLRIKYALLLSIIVGITNIIPYFGPFFGGIVGFFLLILVNPLQALWFGIIIIVLQQFDGNILGPKILGDSTGLSPFWVIFAIIIFGKLFGVIGMFLGVPTFAVIRNIFRRHVNFHYHRKSLKPPSND